MNNQTSAKRTQSARTQTRQTRTKSTNTVGFAFAGLALGAAAGLAYYFRSDLIKALSLGQSKVSPDIQAKLPIANDLKTVSDFEGNYDMDGVSYDIEGVIVGSDETKHVASPI